jgi:putative ABC transport system permease protein
VSAFVAGPGRLRLAFAFAWRDLRGGLAGFGVFIACIAIGVAAITGVAAIARSLTDGLAREGRTIIGSDAAFVLIHREATEAERRFLAERGEVHAVAFLRGMARAADGTAALVEAKAVGEGYPRHGRLETSPPSADVAALLAPRNGVHGALAEPLLFARLGVRPGDRIRFGEKELELRAVIEREPDKLAGGIGFGPRLILSVEALRNSGLIQPGSLIRWSYRTTLPGMPEDRAVAAFIAEVKAALPDTGWEIRSRMNSSPQFERQLERFTQFLTMVGLTALLVGGVGVANAARAFVDRRRTVFATMKSLGATGGFVFTVSLIEVMALALLGILIGLAAGSALPFLLAGLFGSLLPFPFAPSVYPSEAALGVLYGGLTALAFSVWPLGQAHDIPVSTLLRDGVEPAAPLPRWPYVVATATAVAALLASVILLSWDRRIALIYVAAAGGAFVLLRLVGLGVMAVARRLPHPGRLEARMALAALHRPGAMTPSVVLSLGLGLTLLVALGLIDSNLGRQLTSTLPARAPSFFFIDIPGGETARFEDFLKDKAGDGKVERVPMMRGRIVSLKGIPAERYKAPEQVGWVLEGDRGITFAVRAPETGRIIKGEWWPEDYRGPPLVSFSKDIAEGLGLDIGDSLVVNVLGRNIAVRVANIRTVEWRTMGINFVMIFSPNTFAGAPHTSLATLTYSEPADAAREIALAREVALAFPAVSTVRVKEALEAINQLVGQLATAIRGASVVALATSVLVLASALAAGHRRRIRDAVTLKTLGATRGRLLYAYVVEYGLLGLVTAIFGLIAGSLAAALIVGQVMNLPFAMDWVTAIIAVTLALAVTILLGLLGTWRILGQKPAPYLRNL